MLILLVISDRSLSLCAAPPPRSCAAGAHLARKHEKGTCPLSHTSLVTPVAGEHTLLEQMAAPAAATSLEASLRGPDLGQLVEQLPEDQATA